MGNVLSAGQGQAPARQAALGAGLPAGTGCTTVNKMCGSGMRAVMYGADQIGAGSADFVRAGGLESMTNAPYLLPKARAGYRMGHAEILDHMFYDGLQSPWDGKLMGCFADATAARYGFSRADQDAFALRSQQRAAAAQAMSSARYDEALGHFSRAAQRDPTFGLAYAGMAISSRNIDRQQDAEKYIKQAVSQLDGMTERERYRTRGLYYMITGDSGQCVKEFSDLIARYAADASARNNLALCLTYLRNMPQALAEMQQVVKILPRRALYRENLALYAAYSGDFETAIRFGATSVRVGSAVFGARA